MQPAHGFKWHTCPAPPLPVYPSTLGAANSPFVHPGHELTIVLNEVEARQTGGFSLASDGNQIAISFRSLFGPSITLPPSTATTASNSALTFRFPDSWEEVAEVLSGPVEIQVFASDTLVAHIGAGDLVALPPTNDLTPILLSQNPEQIVLAALGADGDLWIPAGFRNDPMDPTLMPGCPGNFIQPLPVNIAAASVLGDLFPPLNPLGRIRGIAGYLGDVEIDGSSFYGMFFPERISLVHVGDTLGVSICRLNDAIDLVLRVRGDQSWANARSSPFQLAARRSRPLALQLKSAPFRPGIDALANQSEPDRQDRRRAQMLEGDSFSNRCPQVDDR